MSPFLENEQNVKKHQKALKEAEDKVPAGLWKVCPQCGTESFWQDLGRYNACLKCAYGFRLKARARLTWLVDSFLEMDQELVTDDPLDFPNYQAKLVKAQQETQLNDSILTGIATIGTEKFALGIMEPNFIMGSLGKVTGEKLARLFERARQENLPVVVFTASGGARMQEGIASLMQMAKVSNAIAQHAAAGLFYLSVLCDPTTGGVLASFASQADIILAEPHALIGFTGRRVIEQTLHQKIAPDLQQAETVLRNGFIDAIVERKHEKQLLQKLLKLHTGGKVNG